MPSVNRGWYRLLEIVIPYPMVLPPPPLLLHRHRALQAHRHEEAPSFIARGRHLLEEATVRNSKANAFSCAVAIAVPFYSFLTLSIYPSIHPDLPLSLP
jgi:hypothetical protein